MESHRFNCDIDLKCLYHLLLMLTPKFGISDKKYEIGKWKWIQIGNIRYPMNDDEWQYCKELYAYDQLHKN